MARLRDRLERALIWALSIKGGRVFGTDQEPTDEELAAAGLAFVAEFERRFGPIPDEVIAEVQRKWTASSPGHRRGR